MTKCAGYTHRFNVWIFPFPSKEDSVDTDPQLVWKPYFMHTVPHCQTLSPHILLIEYIRSVHVSWSVVSWGGKVQEHSDNIYGMITFISPHSQSLFQHLHTSPMIDINAQEQYFKQNMLHTQKINFSSKNRIYAKQKTLKSSAVMNVAMLILKLFQDINDRDRS